MEAAPSWVFHGLVCVAVLVEQPLQEPRDLAHQKASYRIAHQAPEESPKGDYVDCTQLQVAADTHLEVAKERQWVEVAGAGLSLGEWFGLLGPQRSPKRKPGVVGREDCAGTHQEVSRLTTLPCA